MTLKLFLIKQNVNNDYDTYSDAVVCAPDEMAARLTHPDGRENWDGSKEPYSSWAAVEDVQAEYIGEAAPNLKADVICASYHAG